ncbi:MAG: succinate dehydrogenase iron-sulfur subunit [Acetobacteraceae bacterium]|nr:succinate dehydrogenase iron-sulfur subunit [Acetobacteraceae bacterium]
MAATKNVTLNVFRFNPDVDSRPRYDTFSLEARPGMTVLEAMFEVLESLDGSLAFRYCCRGAVCGACAMYINGAHRLACKTQLDLVGPTVTVSPLPFMRVIKDLVVDMSPFWANYEKVMPYLIERSQAPGGERIQSPRQRAVFDDATCCILCGSCYSSCPSVWTGGGQFLGPSALNKAWRFIADSRDGGAAQRLAVVASENGLWRCHTAFNCTEACPKNTNPTQAIQKLKGRAVLHALTGRGRG